MGYPIYANLAEGTLANTLSTSSSVLTLATGNGAKFPAVQLTGSESYSDFFYLTLFKKGLMQEYGHEIVKVRAHSSGSDFFTIERGQDGTTASAFEAGDFVQLRLCRANLNEFPVGRPNLLFNGGFEADSLQGVQVNNVAFPCWYTQVAASNVSLIDSDPGLNNGYGMYSQRYLNLRVDWTPSSPYVLLSQPVPRHLVHGRRVTFSFFARVGQVPAGLGITKVLAVDWLTSGVTPSIDGADQVITVTDTFQRFSVSFDVYGGSGPEVDPQVSFRIFDASDFKNFNFFVADLKLEIGSQATQFTSHPFSTNMAAAKRHCQVLGRGLLGSWAGPTACEFTVPLDMRGTPTVTSLSATPTVIEVGIAARTAVGSVLTTTVSNSNMVRFSFNGFTGSTIGRGAMSDSPLVSVVAN